MNFYPRSPCGERPVCLKLLATLLPISIHALLAESDLLTLSMAVIPILFLSTLSLRRATVNTADQEARKRLISIHALLAESDVKDRPRPSTGIHDFYPRSPCGERHTWQRGSRITYVISIHALLAESDVMRPVKLADAVLFLSTLSLRRATPSQKVFRS